MASIVSLRTAAAGHLPEVDDHLVEPGTPYEMWDGELVYVPPCDAPHGTRQSTLSALLEFHVAPGFAVACELLTRTSLVDDVAPDVSVFPAAPHPVTGHRQLQVLAFEVVSTQRISDAARKAAKLAGRGVRRVFAIDLQRDQVLEWTTAHDRWRKLPADGDIVDPALAVPLPIAPLITTAHAEDAVARALITKRNPVVTKYRAKGVAKARAKGRAEGEAKGRAEGEAKGRAEGEAKGRAEGEAKGRAEGEAKGRAEGEAKGRAEGEAKGRAEGEAKGRAEGIAEAKTVALLVVLAAHGIAIDAVSRRRILDERDPARLDRWLARAARYRTIADVLAER